MKHFTTFSIFVLFLVGCAKDVPPAPVARFEFREEGSNRNGASIKFLNLSTDAIRFNWNFGDGRSSIEHSPTYSFRDNGTYYVTLTAEGEGGKSTFSQSVKINSIPTTGSFIFWTMIGDRGNIDIYINGSLRGTNTKYRTINSAPDCGTDGFVTVTLPEGAYSFTARTKEVFPLTWSGTINVTNGICRSMQLTR